MLRWEVFVYGQVALALALCPFRKNLRSIQLPGERTLSITLKKIISAQFRSIQHPLSRQGNRVPNSPKFQNSSNKLHQQVLSAEGGFKIFFPLYNTILLSTLNFQLSTLALAEPCLHKRNKTKEVSKVFNTFPCLLNYYSLLNLLFFTKPISCKNHYYFITLYYNIRSGK